MNVMTHAQNMLLQLNEVFAVNKTKDKELVPSFEDVCCILQNLFRYLQIMSISLTFGISLLQKEITFSCFEHLGCRYAVYIGQQCIDNNSKTDGNGLIFKR